MAWLFTWRRTATPAGAARPNAASRPAWHLLAAAAPLGGLMSLSFAPQRWPWLQLLALGGLFGLLRAPRLRRPPGALRRLPAVLLRVVLVVAAHQPAPVWRIWPRPGRHRRGAAGPGHRCTSWPPPPCGPAGRPAPAWTPWALPAPGCWPNGCAPPSSAASWSSAGYAHTSGPWLPWLLGSASTASASWPHGSRPWP